MDDTIEAREPGTPEAQPDGAGVQLTVLDRDGRRTTLLLPTPCAAQLLLPLPNVVQPAVRLSQGDNSIRLVHAPEQFKVERGDACDADSPAWILTLSTGEGFEVSFCAPHQSLTSLCQNIAKRPPRRVDAAVLNLP